MQELELTDMIDHTENATSVSMLSKLGAASEKENELISGHSVKIAKFQIKLNKITTAQTARSRRGKLKALEQLDHEKRREKQTQTKKRRRWNWSMRKAKCKKRIAEDFGDMPPLKRYKRQCTIQDRLEVVRWYDKQIDLLKSGAIRSIDDDEDHNDTDEDDQTVPASKRKDKRTRKSHRRKGVNLLKAAAKKFPHIVTENISLGRWSKTAKVQRWEQIPELVRMNQKEIPDDWKRAVGVTSVKGKQRFQKVPREVMKSLDEHMVMVCQGLSSVTKRNEEVLIHEIVIASAKWTKKT